jgi:hypothetical protein
VKALASSKTPKALFIAEACTLKLGVEICPFATDTCSKIDSSLIVDERYSKPKNDLRVFLDRILIIHSKERGKELVVSCKVYFDSCSARIAVILLLGMLYPAVLDHD